MLDCKLRQFLQIFPTHNRGGGVVGVSEDNHLGARGHAFLKFLDLQLIAILLPQRHRDNHTAQQGGVLEVVGIAGVWNQNLVTRINEGHHGEHQARIRARSDDDVTLRIHIQVVELLELLGQRNFQFHIADRHGVVGRSTVLQTGQSGFFHMLRDGRVGIEGVSPAHQGCAVGDEIIQRCPHVCLGDLLKKASLNSMEFFADAILDAHNGFSFLIW